jgi:hypothetical protein
MAKRSSAREKAGDCLVAKGIAGRGASGRSLFRNAIVRGWLFALNRRLGWAIPQVRFGVGRPRLNRAPRRRCSCNSASPAIDPVAVEIRPRRNQGLRF